MNEESIGLRAVLEGRVQGVGMRYFVAERARELQLTGFVRNNRNGNVEVVAEGPKGALEALVVALEIGPGMASIDRVHTVYSPATGHYTSFTINHTM